MNHYRRALAGALACVLMAALPAGAEEHTGFAIQGGLGGSLLRDRDDGAGTFEGTGFGACFGFEYRFVPRFALGLDYFDLGSATDTVGAVEMEVEASGLDFYARLVFPLTETVEAYGRLGSVYYHTDVVNDLGGNPFGDDAVSIGGGLDVGRGAFAFRLEGRYFDGPRDESGALVTAGFALRF